jgi:hypothetical protein
MATRDPNNQNPRNPNNPSHDPYPHDPYPPGQRDWTGYGCAWMWFFWLIILIIIIIGGWGWWGGWWGGNRGWWGNRGPYYGQPVPPGRVEAPNTNQPNANPQTGVVSTPGEFIGRTVTLSGQVDQVMNPKAFTLKSGSNHGRDLLIVAKESPTPAVTKGETVQVTGTVQRFQRTEFQQETKAGLSNAAFTDFTGRPAILASKVSSKP